MASTVSTSEEPTGNEQLFYCHQCTHQWRKDQNSVSFDAFKIGKFPSQQSNVLLGVFVSAMP